jgi:hypothetical protein
MIRKGVSCAVVVSKEWAEVAEVRKFLGPARDGNVDQTRPGHVIYAKAGGEETVHGVWIELYTDREKWSDVLCRTCWCLGDSSCLL